MEDGVGVVAVATSEDVLDLGDRVHAEAVAAAAVRHRASAVDVDLIKEDNIHIVLF